MTHCEQKTNGGHIGALAVIARRYVLVSQPVRIVCLFSDRLAFAEEYKQKRTRLSAI
jgi:hypothetical protein